MTNMKSMSAYLTGDGVCYRGEDQDEPGWTRQDFLDLCFGSVEKATVLFYLCDGQSPFTLLDEEQRDHGMFGDPLDEEYGLTCEFCGRPPTFDGLLCDGCHEKIANWQQVIKKHTA